MLSSICSIAQTNPTPQTLPYTQNFAALTGATTVYPAGIQGWQITGTLGGAFNLLTPTANQTMAGGTNASTGSGVYDMNGKMGLLSTGSAIRTICLSINTTALTTIQVSFLAGTQRTQPADRIGELGLQYRVGNTGAFTNVAGSTYQNINTVANTAGTGSINTATVSVTLPIACEGQAEVQLRWLQRDVSGSNGRPSFSIDDVSVTGTAPATPTLSASTLTSFGSQCTSSTYGPNSFTITGSNLNITDVTVAALAGFTYDTTAAGPYYASMSLPHAVGSYSKVIYVKFSPIAVATYDGNIAIGGGGASSINVAAVGSGILPAAPTVSTPTATAIAATTATLGGNLVAVNCSNATTRGIEWSLTPGFIDGSGTQVTEVGSFGPGVFTESVTGLPSSSIIYYKAFAINGNGTTYTSEASFITLLNIGDITIIGFNSNTPDNFSFVTWVDLPANSKIKFTDNAFLAAASANAASNGRGGENFVAWTNNTASPILAGTVIKIELTTASIGAVTQQLNGLTNGEQIFAYQGPGAGTSATTSDFGTNINPSTFTGSILYGINWQGSAGSATWTGANNTNTSFLPTELNVAGGNHTFGGAAAGGQYTATRNGQATFAGYKALVNNQSNWSTVSSGIVTIDQTAFVLSLGGPTQIVVTDVNGGVSPTVNSPFTIAIETQDFLNIGASVLANTDVIVSLNTGTGALAGTLTGTILAGTSTLVLTGILYNTAEAGVIVTVTRTAGDIISPDNSSPFTVLAAADHLAFNNLSTFSFTNTVVQFFSVEARRPDNTVDNTYTGSATISLISGTGALLGTLSQTFASGIATFNDVSYNATGVKQIEAAAGLFPNITSPNITISTPALAETHLPLYMQGNSATNNTRVPYACRLTLSGLQPSSTYRYTNQAVEAADAATVNGAGNPIFPAAGGYTRTTSASLSTLGSYAELTTDAVGQAAIWCALEPTGNARFTPGNSVYMRLAINNGSGGTFTALRLTTASTISVINFGAGATNGTALRGNSSAVAKNFVLLYDNTAGTGRPISGTFVESDGFANNAGNSYAAYYSSSVDGTAGAYGTIIPNTLPNGILRVEQRSLSQGLIVSCAATDSDGVWPSGANTVNPSSGLTAKVFTSSDAEFNPACVTLTPGNNDNFLSASLSPSSGVAYPAGNCYTGTLVGTSVSTEGTAANVLVTGGQDRWYAITAPSPAVRIVTTTSSMDVVLELHASDGSLIDSENDVAGIGGEIMTTNGLLEGYTYFVAIRSYDGVLGAYTLCVQALMDSRCNDGSGTYDRCSNFKPTWTGANSYTFNFVPTAPTPGIPTSATSVGQIALSNPTLALQHNGTYDATIDVTYNLPEGEIVVIPGNEVCAVNIAPHANVEVKLAQRCPAALLKSSIIAGKPFVCGAQNFTVTATQYTACSGGSPIGFPFFGTTAGASATINLNQINSGGNSIQGGGKWYEIVWTPNFAYGTGTPCTPQFIFVSGAVMDTDEIEPIALEERQSFEVEAAIYPNPNDGEMLNINLVNVESEMVSIRIVDGTGRVVYSNRFAANGSLNTNIHFEQSLANGLYLVEFIAGNEMITERLMIQK